MKALQDKQELRARNKAYKTTLQYCPETCGDVDLYASLMINDLQNTDKFTQEQVYLIDGFVKMLVNDIKDVGTRKLRQSFVDFVLEKQSEEI